MKIVSTPPNRAEPARIAPLSVLPVFMELTGKTALVAGGTEAVAWKAQLLMAAGAHVRLVAPRQELDPDLIELVDDDQAGDTLLHHVDRRWQAADLNHAAIAVADAKDEEEARAFNMAARDAGVPCNVIDRPAFCSFQFGSIVNRSPVVVGISTSGAAPILGQAVRRRIETLLPPVLADWSAFARRMRDSVAATISTAQRRRAFWEALVDRAFGTSPPSNDEDTSNLLTAQAERQGAGGGKVTFVGAGPGDAEHLTLKAVRALQSADVILFDDLVSDAVLELARREAKRILVGKRAGRPSCGQPKINEMMTRLAKSGRHVVRLKSGDPMIFGRGGEGIECLEASGIPFAVVPGLSTGMALAASLTHRDLTSQNGSVCHAR